MNNIAIFLRKELNKNRFSESVLGALNSTSVDEAIICSGFFQEDNSYSVSSKKFQLYSRCPSHLNLSIIGYYGWQKHTHPIFLNNLINNNCPICLSVKGYRIPGDKWHAKVCIAKQNGTPIFAAIGSSNITKRAFDTLDKFNYECDVIFWDETTSEISSIINNIIGETSEEFPSVVVTKYDRSHPTNRFPLRDRLLSLEREIFSKAKPIP